MSKLAYILVFAIGCSIGSLAQMQPEKSSQPYGELDSKKTAAQIGEDIGSLKSQVSVQDQDIKNARQQIRLFLARLADRKQDAIARAALPSGANTEIKQAGFLTSIDAAADELDAALKSDNVINLWKLFFDLLARGPAGYDKIIELAPVFERNMKESRPWWTRQEELVMGPFFRELTDHGEDMIKFVLYLDTVEEDRLGKSAKRLRDRFLTEDMGPILLGYMQVRDPKLITLIEDHLIERLDVVSPYRKREVIRSMAQIPGERLTKVLVYEIDGEDWSKDRSILSALRFRKDPSAIKLLSKLSKFKGNEQLNMGVSSLIEHLRSL